MTRLENILLAIRPRFDTIPHAHKCLHCRKYVEQGSSVTCPCKCRFYCSADCRTKDHHNHAHRCEQIRSISDDIEGRADRLITQAYGVEAVFYHDFPENISDPSGVVVKEVTEYFSAREKLIQELIIEGRRVNDNCTGGIGENEVAFDVAITQCYDMFFLRQKSYHSIHTIQNIYLLAGRFSDLYDLSSYVARKGLECNGLEDLDHIQNQISHQNVASPFFKHFVVNHDRAFDQSSMCHLFIVKCWLHFNVTNLVAINEQFIDNRDCMNLIGQFLGVEEEWIVNDKNLYRDQAYEIARHFHCEVAYFELDPDSQLLGLEFIREFASKHSSSSETDQIIDATIETASKWIYEMKKHQKQVLPMSDSRWTNAIKSYKADHDHIVKFQIQPVLPWATETINELAGYNAIGRTFNPSSYTITQFITDGMNVCQDRKEFFQSLFSFMNGWERWCEDHDARERVEESIGFPKDNWFNHAIIACLLIEQKLAQCHFHKNKGCPKIKELLDFLPEGHTKYCCDPSPELEDGPFDEEILHPDWEKTASSASSWLDDVTNIVDALVDNGLATNENLALLFGRSGYVSYRIWELHQEKLEKDQPKIEPFCKRSKVWREGCIEYDTSSGLKIQYLKLQERRQKYDELSKAKPTTRNLVQSMEPPIHLFVDHFGWANLNNKHTMGSHEYGCFNYDLIDLQSGSADMKGMIRKIGLDKFQTGTDACRHYFDAITIEEAIWDFVGIPRLVVLNGDLETMHKSGWTYLGDKLLIHKLGDKSVQVGSRCAHVYIDGNCIGVWKEKQEGSVSFVGTREPD